MQAELISRIDLQRRLKVLAIVGVFAISGLGSCLHFVYEWSGYSVPFAIVGSVNESTWEHLKLCFWPTLLWAIFETTICASLMRQILFAKLLGIIVMMVSITSGAWLIELTIGHLLIVDIGLFVLSVGLGQWTSWWITRKVSSKQKHFYWAVIGWATLAIGFTVFTFAPPRISIFRDPITQSYGLPKEIIGRLKNGQPGKERNADVVTILR